MYSNPTFWSVTLDLLRFFGQTLEIFAVTLAVALPLGLIICLGEMSKFKPFSWFCQTLVWVMRGTPLMLQLIVVYYGPGLIGLTPMSIKLATFLTFSINYACYFSEIYRGGIQSVTKGQYEAAQVLGMTKAQTFFHVILLQVIKRVVPPMSNEIITLVKDTSLAKTIGYYEIIFAANRYLNNAGLLWPLFYAGGFYLIFSGVVTILLRYLEKKLDYFKV